MVCATPARLAGTRRRFNILLNVVFLLTLTEIFSSQNEAFLPRNWKSSPTPLHREEGLSSEVDPCSRPGWQGPVHRAECTQWHP